jgi:hypothetical protein
VTIDRDQLLRAARAVRQRAASQAMEAMDDAQLEQVARFSPIWATVPNPPAAGEPLTDAHLESFILNCSIAEALGIQG